MANPHFTYFLLPSPLSLDARSIVFPMMNRLRSHKAFAMIAALILLAAFGLAFFHSHAEDGEDHECPVCRMVQAFGLLFAAVWVLFATGRVKVRSFLPVSHFAFQPLFLTAKLRDRSPPFLT